MDRRVVVALAAVGVLVARRRRAHRTGPRPRADRWHAVTVNRPPADVGAPAGPWPAPLARLGRRIEVDARPAPGGRGTELRARARRRPDDDLDGRIRDALRRSRSLVETGVVLSADRPGTTERTLLNRPLEAAIRRGREEGRL